MDSMSSPMRVQLVKVSHLIGTRIRRYAGGIFLRAREHRKHIVHFHSWESRCGVPRSRFKTQKSAKAFGGFELQTATQAAANVA